MDIEHKSYIEAAVGIQKRDRKKPKRSQSQLFHQVKAKPVKIK
jgi:hypothetical protein